MDYVPKIIHHYRGEVYFGDKWASGQLLHMNGKYYIIPFNANTADRLGDVLVRIKPGTVSIYTGITVDGGPLYVGDLVYSTANPDMHYVVGYFPQKALTPYFLVPYDRWKCGMNLGIHPLPDKALPLHEVALNTLQKTGIVWSRRSECVWVTDDAIDNILKRVQRERIVYIPAKNLAHASSIARKIVENLETLARQGRNYSFTKVKIIYAEQLLNERILKTESNIQILYIVIADHGIPAISKSDFPDKKMIIITTP